jgi:WhiB family redox-sensing transcriptional regulator
VTNEQYVTVGTGLSRGGNRAAESAPVSQARIPCTTCGRPCRSHVTLLCQTCFLALPPNKRPSLYYQNGPVVASATPTLRDPLDTSWHPEGQCRQEDPELFYHPPETRGSTKTRRENLAKKICAECPVKELCRDQARANREQYGVWGAETEDERKAWLRKQRPSSKPKAVAA